MPAKPVGPTGLGCGSVALDDKGRRRERCRPAAKDGEHGRDGVRTSASEAHRECAGPGANLWTRLQTRRTTEGVIDRRPLILIRRSIRRRPHQERQPSRAVFCGRRLRCSRGRSLAGPCDGDRDLRSAAGIRGVGGGGRGEGGRRLLPFTFRLAPWTPWTPCVPCGPWEPWKPWLPCVP